MKLIKNLLFLIFVLGFIYLRINPIINQTVPYTYDQGRDFLKAEEIVRFRNPTFIGPTTGIMGLNHGAWWYYLLSIPYFLFNGHPMGFYYFMFFISLISNLAFFYFLKKEFNFNTALLFLAIITISPYFIPLSFFVSNNIITPYVILLLIISLYYLFKTKNLIFILLTGLSIGFIHEFEVAFGLFMIPITTLILIIFKQSRKILLSLKGILCYFIGLIIALTPRILFEIKYQFIQTKTLINFFLKPKLHNPKAFFDVLNDRTLLFWNYFKGIFIEYNFYISLLMLLTFTFVTIKYKKELKKHSYFTLILLIILLLFIGSLFYNDNFWSNYYEGIQYLMLFIVLVSFYVIEKKEKILSKIIFVAFVVILPTLFFSKEIKNKNNQLKDFKAIDKAVVYLFEQTKNKDFCLKIYTPPVIPYTYDYLISYYSKIKNINRPMKDYVNNKCYFIIEADSYKFRVEKWRKENIPVNGKKLLYHRINKDIEIELWQR